MTWTQVYNPLGNIGLSALVAAIPLFILLYMLGVRRSKGHHAAIVGVTSAVLLAILVWGMPAGLAISATLNGAMFGIFPIVWIVVTAIWVYNMTVESGEFEIIKNSLASITDDRRLQALFIAFAFGSFIEGTAGFGTPVAITAAMLVGLGFNPIYAAGICLIANTAPVAFGAIGIPIVVAANVTQLDMMHISQIVGRQLPFLSIIVPLWLVVTMCGWKRAMEVLPAVLVAGICFAGTQFITSNYVNPYLPDITSAVVTIVGLLVFLKVWKPANVWHFPNEKPAATGGVKLQYTTGEVLRAWAPYIILAVLVFLWADDKYLKLKLSLLNIDKAMPWFTISWPGLDGLVMKAAPVVAKPSPYPAKYVVNIFSAAGTAIFLSGLLSLFIIPNYGFGRAMACFGRTIKQLIYPIFTIAMILGLAYIMNYSGMSSTLGLAFTATGALFPFFSPILGWLGVFLTGSDTSSNALFGSMQKTAAQQIGVDPNLTVAANSSGGVCGKMISPQSISVATAATGLVGEEGTIFRFTLWHSIAMILFMAVLTYLQAYALRWMLP
ncbi:L-lactate transport [Thermosinus carboxydivorans Nor1]|uniref:L-lactate permease n=1 Tax=Thermosinus carboxydivorans Nor1 TaxID=401526 RepID=A1HP54_9FIRM|nr:lactate permease LctP family transporter [Thermosinus carboxydivorans]EAX48162.1 L-lactate transport [Thermosinus carboxydivorans Nor1]